MRNIASVYSAPRGHWVGDGFPVRSLFTYDRMGPQHISPFLMLDYAGPADFAPSEQTRGVGQHPHRGFETVTIVYQGELEHQDSTGAGGRIGAGDVQWMTAGSGILHEECHSEGFSRSGGTLEMVQLWVNLPARDKEKPAGYQTLMDADIPDVALADDAGRLRVIAGDYEGESGPAQTFTPMNVWDIRLKQGKTLRLTPPEGHTALLVALHGTVQVNDSQIVREAGLVCFERDGDELVQEANSDATLLFLSGEPIDEPVVGHGPFVMNSADGIRKAMLDFGSGKYGTMKH